MLVGKDDLVPKKLYLDVCSKCDKPLDNKLLTVCKDCGGGVLCKDCVKKHKINYPKHKLINKKEKENEIPNKKDKEIPDEDNNYDNEKNKGKSKDKLKDKKPEKYQMTLLNDKQPIKCILCKNIVPFKNNKFIIHCNKCQGNLCDNCVKPHSKKNPTHKVNSFK